MLPCLITFNWFNVDYKHTLQYIPPAHKDRKGERKRTGCEMHSSWYASLHYWIYSYNMPVKVVTRPCSI